MSGRALSTITLTLAVVTSPAHAQYEAGGQPARAPAESSLKKALKEGRVVIGATITVPNVDTALAAASAGFDFLWIEMEHSPVSLEGLRQIVLATRGTGAVPITRVPVNEPWLAKRVLDMGSLGVIFPFTSTRELAEQAVASCKYPPLGIRGFGAGLAASAYGLAAADYVNFADENVLVVVIVEQKQAIDNIEAIAAVPGIDVIFIGANDLSYSLGVRGRTTEPVVEQAVEKVVAAAGRRGIPVGYPAGSPAEINKRIAQGIRFFQAGNELGLMRSGARELLSRVERPSPAPSPRPPTPSRRPRQ
jgi:2-keto-3-deoxy-L-rhamnonate aldolase RhmA